MITETVFAAAALRDLDRLDPQVARRILQAVQRYVTSDRGDIRRLHGSRGELRLRVGDWRVRFTDRVIVRPVEPPATGEVRARMIEVLRVLPRDKAYRD